jgi:hypothetical protein
MQGFLLASLTVTALFAVPPAYAGGGISFASGLMGGIVGGTQDRTQPTPRVSPQTQEVPLPPVKPVPAIVVIPSPQPLAGAR